MISEMSETPRSLRIHIGVFGAANAGKSTLINAVTGQDTSLVSSVAGTTTDPVFKPMELLPLGPVVFIDTAGLDDNSELGALRVKKSMQQLDSCDAAVLVIASDKVCSEENAEYHRMLSARGIPVITVINRFANDAAESAPPYAMDAIWANLSQGETDGIKAALISALEGDAEPTLTAGLVKAGDVVLLVAPQNIQAPKGRLILPQVQTLRDLLDKGCIPVTVTDDMLEQALELVQKRPSLVITDSQIFGKVAAALPKETLLTSFSILTARAKGSISAFAQGAQAIGLLRDGDKVLILESCTHHPLDGDIARQKLPAALLAYTGKKLEFTVHSGRELPEDIRCYALAVHCGGCMLNRRAMLSRQRCFAEAGVPLTNFGIALAKLSGILERALKAAGE